MKKLIFGIMIILGSLSSGFGSQFIGIIDKEFCKTEALEMGKEGTTQYKEAYDFCIDQQLTRGEFTPLEIAIGWMHYKDLTIFNTVADYKPNNYIRRDEAAKLFVNFAKIRNKTTYVKTSAECTFSDLNDAHKDLKDIVVESCRLGIFQGANGKFMPRGSLTNEQAVAVLVRIVDKIYDETKTKSWSDVYYQKANDFDILSKVSMNDRKLGATRGNVGQIIYLANNLPSGDASVSQTDILYTNTEYGFTLNFPSSWAGYTVSQDKRNIFIEINGEIVLDIHPILKSEEILNGLLLGENSKYRFVSYGSDISSNPDTILKTKDINNILKTFKIL